VSDGFLQKPVDSREKQARIVVSQKERDLAQRGIGEAPQGREEFRMTLENLAGPRDSGRLIDDFRARVRGIRLKMIEEIAVQDELDLRFREFPSHMMAEELDEGDVVVEVLQVVQVPARQIPSAPDVKVAGNEL
jgi:hypothetical protein